MKIMATETTNKTSGTLEAICAGVNFSSPTALEYNFYKQDDGAILGSVLLDTPTLAYGNLISNTLSIFYDFGNKTYDPWLIKAIDILNFAALGLDYLIATGNLENFPSSIFSLIEAASPVNDNIYPWTPGDNLILGRSGSDRLLGVNPGDTIPGKNEIDILLGGPNTLNTPGLNNDVYLLGDYNNAYYAGNQGVLGTENFAFLPFFNSSTDTIELHGTPSDYYLVNYKVEGITGRAETGTAIVLNSPQPDLIALLPGVSGLSLDAKYFNYVNTPPPNEIQPQIQQFGTTSFDAGLDVATDSNGNAYVSGLTGGSLGGLNAADSTDGYVAKYDSNGNQLWSRQFGTPALEYAFGNVVDRDNNVYITGGTTGSLAAPNPGGSMDAYVVKYDSNGNQQWIRQIESPDFEESYHIAADSQNNVYIAGATTGDLGGKNAGVTSLTGDPYVAKFDSNGNQQWITQFGSPEFEDTFGVATDSNDNIFVTGWTYGDLAGSNAGLYDVWLAKLDSSGDLLWTRQFGTPNYDFPWANATDSFGNVYITGWTLGSLGGTNAGLDDGFLAKYDTNGNQLWVKQFGSAGADQIYDISIDSNNLVYVTGLTTSDLGGLNAGAEDAFIAQFDSNGNLLGIDQFGTSGIDNAYGIDAKFPDRLYVAGGTDGSLGGIHLGSYDTFLSASSFVEM
jgi:hypothetical protein